jgi:galactokinase
MNEEKKIPISDNYEKNGDWSDYIKGVIIELSRIKPLKYGVDVAFKSEVPMGSGLSSSAAFELINAKLLSYVNDIELSNKELALLSQRAENNFIGVKCGIMDQFAVALGEQDAALFLDTMTLDYEVVKLNLNNYKIVISNTNKPRQLSDSKYNERRAECEQVVSIFNKLNPEIKSLRDVNINFLESNKTHLDTVLYKRAKHVISENKRVLDSVKFLKSGSLNKFGELMVESHNSLRNLYEVSCKELDTLVDEFVKYDGVLGSRMTGAGFGGCTVSIINNSSIDEIIKKVDMVYQDKTGLKAEHYIVDAESGVRIIK